MTIKNKIAFHNFSYKYRTLKIMEEDSYSGYMSKVPTEILLDIFRFLPAKQLIRCRLVCVRWNNIIESLVTKDSLWLKYTEKDFKDVYDVARKKARRGMLCYHVYRSLSLWPRLTQARESIEEFANASKLDEEIKGFQVLQNGIVGVHTRSAIVYYDIETLQPAARRPIPGDYLSYDENDNIIVLTDPHMHLYVVRKFLENPIQETHVTFDYVKTYLLVDKFIFYVNLQNMIFSCDLQQQKFKGKYLDQTEDSVMCLGYNGTLHVATCSRNIYSLAGDKLYFTCSLEESPNLLNQLHKYRFIDNLDWRVFFNWTYILNHTVPNGPLRDTIVVRTYGDIMFVGSSNGVLGIYLKPFTYGELTLFESQPVKQYNFMQPLQVPVLSVCPILEIDATEFELGHKVIVAMPKKMVVIEFTHCFKRTATEAMLPFSDLQRVKLLKIE